MEMTEPLGKNIFVIKQGDETHQTLFGMFPLRLFGKETKLNECVVSPAIKKTTAESKYEPAFI